MAHIIPLWDKKKMKIAVWDNFRLGQRDFFKPFLYCNFFLFLFLFLFFLFLFLFLFFFIFYFFYFFFFIFYFFFLHIRTLRNIFVPYGKFVPLSYIFVPLPYFFVPFLSFFVPFLFFLSHCRIFFVPAGFLS